MHVLYLLLGWVETHTSHHVRNCFKRHFAIKLSCLSRMLILRPDLRVIKEVFEITHNLPIGAPLKQLWEWILIGISTKTFCKNRKIDLPHINTKIIPSGRKKHLAINQTTNTRDFGRMRNQPHRIVRITIKWKFNYPNNLLFRSIGQVLILIVVFLIGWVEDQKLVDLAAVGWT